MTSFKTLDELNEFNNQNFKKVFGNRRDLELFENPFKEGTFENLKAAAVPHKEFEYDKFTYHSIEFADKLLPYIKNSYTSKGVTTFDGANLFEGVKRAERKLFVFDDNEYLINVVNYTYPKGVESEKKKTRAIANDNEVLSFIELGENNEVEVHFKFGKRFKNHLEEVLKDKRESAATLENKVYNFNTTSFKKNFEEGMVHDTMMRFVLNTLGVENEAKELASYNQFFTTNVLNYLDDFKILNKYKVRLFIAKSQREAGLQSGDLDLQPVKVFEPLPNEIFVWFVSEDKVKFDTSFIKVKLGTNAAKELLAKEITVDDITNYLLRIIESEIPNGIFKKKRVQKEVNKSAALAVFQLYSKNKIESSPIAKEVFLSSPIAFYAIQGLSYLSEGIEKLKLSDNVWDKRNKDYAPLLPNSFENAYVCGLINGSVQFLKDIPDSASFLLSVLNSEQAFNEFVEALRKLFTDTEVLKALFEKSIQGYKEGLYVKNTEKILYQLGYDTIQIVSFFIGVVQFAKGVASFAKFVKNAITYLKKNGKKGIAKLKKLNKKQIEEVFDELDKIGKNLDSVRLKKLDLDEWKKIITKRGGKVRNVDESKELLKYFEVNDVGAAFDAFEIPPTIWIRNGATDLELFHEAMHFEDFLRRGKRNFQRGFERLEYPFGNKPQVPKRDQIINEYIKEKYVFDKIIEEQKSWLENYGKGRFTQQEMDFSAEYFSQYQVNCILNGIDVKKIKLKE